MKTKNRIAGLFGAAAIAAAVIPFAGTAPAMAAEDCPAGTTLVAKFQNNGGNYTLDAGTPGVVTITNGTNSGGNFTSTVVITAVFVKGGTASKTDLYPAGVFSGSFSSGGLVNEGEQVPAISHVSFCTGPTTPPPSTPVTTPVTTPASTPAASVLPTKASATTEVKGTKNQKPPAILPKTGAGLSLGMALAISLGLLLGGAALMFFPRGLTAEKGKRRRH
jgi:hypothetical protein